MCVHIIQRYDDAMKEKGREARERKERDICIYKIYRVGPLLSAGLVSMRQHALLLYARAYYAHAHAHDAYERARTDTHAPWHAWARPRTHTRTRA